MTAQSPARAQVFQRIYSVAFIGLLAYFVYNYSEKPVPEFPEPDFQGMADYLVDAGFDPTTHPDSQALLEERILVLTTDVNAMMGRDIIRKLLLLNAQDPNEPINLYIRTEGGWGADAFAIIDTMHSLNAPVNIHAIGEVHSAGIMILSAGTGQRIAYPSTIFGFHALADDEDPVYEKRYLALWDTYAKLPTKWLNRRDDEMSYFHAKDALTYGIVDTIWQKPTTQSE